MIKLNQLLKKRKETFLLYVMSGPISTELKEPLLKFLKFDEHNDDIYYCYPEMFAPLFRFTTEEKKQKIEQVNIAAYFIYISLKFLDSLLDNALSAKESKKALLMVLITQEEGIKILGTIFNTHSDFWQTWNKRRSEYMLPLAVKLNDNVSWEQYEKLSESKSAFAKIAIDIWMRIAPENSNNAFYDKLLESHRLFTVGFQILDDIIDFKKDYEGDHFNIAYNELKKILADKNIDCSDFENLEKHLYVQGVARKLIENAISYFDQCLLVLGNIKDEIPIWAQFVYLNRRQAHFFILQIDCYFKRLFFRKTLSTQFLNYHDTSSNQHAILVSKIKKGINYIQSRQDKRGGWEDLYNSAGTSDVWATAYVLLNIEYIPAVSKKSISQALEFLISNPFGEGWGYTTQAPLADTDSTTCVLYSLYKNNIPIDNYVTPWLNGQTGTGGFATYKYENDLNDFLANSVDSVSGWLQPHPCVSALAYYFLSQYDVNSPAFKKLENYIIEEQKDNGEWESYWWTSPAYATCYALLGMVNSNYHAFSKSIDHGIAALLKNSFDTNRLVDAHNKEGSVFYTSLFLKVLLSHPKIRLKYRDQINSIVRWLLSKQYTDGSFASSFSLRVPPAHVNVSQINIWEANTKDKNKVSEDFSRLFSTAMIILPLSENIEIHSMTEDKYLIHQTEYSKRIVINKKLYHLIQQLDKNRHINIQQAIAETGVTPFELNNLYATLADYGIVESNKKVSRVHPASYLTIRSTIIPERIVLAVSSVFSFLFDYWLFAVSFIAFSVFNVELIINHLNFKNLLIDFNGPYLLKLQVIFVVGLFLHEFGHSSACKKFGANPGPIGFGFYLLSPVLYADVSDVWKLNRYQRLIVDLGGIYMQLLYCTILGLFYLYFNIPMLIVIIGLHLTTIVVNLNPFFRFDGYWALSDLTNIYNLRPKALEKVNALIKKMRGRPNSFSLKSSNDIFLFVYGFICYWLLFTFLFYMLVKNPQSVLYFPINLYYFIESAIHHHLSWISVKVETRRLIVPLAFYIMVIKAVMRNWDGIRRTFKNLNRYEV